MATAPHISFMSAACPLFGLVLRVRCNGTSDRERLLVALRDELLDARGLVLTEGHAGDECIVTGDGFQATDADREAIVSWLDGRREVATYSISALGDVGSAA